MYAVIPQLSVYENLAYHDKFVEVFDVLDTTRELFRSLPTSPLTSRHLSLCATAFLAYVMPILAIFGTCS